jgi:hypothetical protein
MSVNTDQLIDVLVRELRAVRPLRSPGVRTAFWFLVSGTYMAILVAAMSHGGSRFATIHLSRFWLEQAAAIGVGIAAAAGALMSTVPGRRRTWLALPAVPIALWLAILASGCLHDWAGRGAAGFAVYDDWPCVAAMLLGAFVPVAAMIIMVRRGAPLTPTLTAGLAGLAGAALSSVVACVSRPTPHPTTVTVIAWHLGTLLAVVAATASAGRHLLAWPMDRVAIDGTSLRRIGRMQ